MECGKQVRFAGGRKGADVSSKQQTHAGSEPLPLMVWRNRHSIMAGHGQGTVEYAILVGILVVIAILAITVFRPKIQELWDAIASGINGL